MAAVFAVGGSASGMPSAISPCPGALAASEPVVMPPRVGVAGAAPANSQDSAIFEAPIGPGQTMTLRISLNVQFIATGSPAPKVDYKLFHVRGTQPSTALVMCDTTPRLMGNVTPDRNPGFSTKSVEVVHVLSAPNPGDDPYPVLDFAVWTRGTAIVDWKVTLEPCGYPCVEPILFPGPCDPLADPRTCVRERGS